MSMSGNVAPWYADYANYVISGALPDDLNYHQSKQFLFDVKKDFGMNLFGLGMIRLNLLHNK